MLSILKQKKIIVVIIIIIIILIGLNFINPFKLISFFGIPISESYIKNEIEKANYCEVEEDCVRTSGRSFGWCGISVNKDEVKRIKNLVSSFKLEGSMPRVKCSDLSYTECEYDRWAKRKKCIIKIGQMNGDEATNEY